VSIRLTIKQRDFFLQLPATRQLLRARFNYYTAEEENERINRKNKREKEREREREREGERERERQRESDRWALAERCDSRCLF